MIKKANYLFIFIFIFLFERENKSGLNLKLLISSITDECNSLEKNMLLCIIEKADRNI